MATYHLNVRSCSKSKGQSASAKSDYINREDKYTKNKDDLIYSESGNMPSFAQDNPKDFWKSADEFERANARVCTEIEFALPRELNLEQHKELITEFINKNLDNENHKLTYSYAIHNDKENHNPHCHLIFSERNNDGIERTAEQFFRRANNKDPSKGGAKKSEHAHKREFVQEVRTSWRETANEHLSKAGFTTTIDERTLEAQGIDRPSPRRLNRDEFQQVRELEKALTATEKEIAEINEVQSIFSIMAAPKNNDMEQLRKEREAKDAELKRMIQERAKEVQAEVQARNAREEAQRAKAQAEAIKAQEQAKKAQEEAQKAKAQAEALEARKQAEKAQEFDYRKDQGFQDYKNEILHARIKDKQGVINRFEGETNSTLLRADKAKSEFKHYEDRKIQREERLAELQKENSKIFILPSTRADNKRRIESLKSDIETEIYFMDRVTKQSGKLLKLDEDTFRKERAELLDKQLANYDEKSREIARYENLIEGYEKHKEIQSQVREQELAPTPTQTADIDDDWDFEM